MTVGQLIGLLRNEDLNRIVILQKDGEGNGYSPLSRYETASYLAESTYSGEVHPENLTPEHIEQGFTEEDIKGGIPALVLVPIN